MRPLRRESVTSQFQQEREDLEEQNLALVQSCRDVEERCEKLQEQLEAIERERDSLLLQKEAELENKFGEKGRTSVASHSSIGLRSVVQGIVLQKREDRNQQIDRMTAHVEELQRELEAAREEVLDAKQEMDGLHAHIHELEQEAARLKHDRDVAVCAGLQLNEELEELRVMVRARNSTGAFAGLGGERSGSDEEDEVPAGFLDKGGKGESGGKPRFSHMGRTADFESLAGLLDQEISSEEDDVVRQKSSMPDVVRQKSSMPAPMLRKTASRRRPAEDDALAIVAKPCQEQPDAPGATSVPLSPSSPVAGDLGGSANLGSPAGDLGGSTGEGSVDSGELERLWVRFRELSAEAEDLRKKKEGAECEGAQLTEQVKRLRVEVERADREIAELRQGYELQREFAMALEAQLASGGTGGAEAAAAAANAEAAAAEAAKFEAACLTFGDADAGLTQDSRKRAMMRKNKLKAWAEESKTKLQVGTRVKVLRTIIYGSAQDVSKQYQLESGLKGTVTKIDKDGDAEVNWEGIGKKWLLNKDFYKVSVEEPTKDLPWAKGPGTGPLKGPGMGPPKALMRTTTAVPWAMDTDLPWEVDTKEPPKNCEGALDAPARTSVISARDRAGTDKRAERRQRARQAVNSASLAQRYFQVGQAYETRSDVILRAAEALDSEQRGELKTETQVTLLEICAAADRRVRVRCEASQLEGWMSKMTQGGVLLLGRLEPVCCTKGHRLKLVVGCAAGQCDQCGTGVEAGSQVMDCEPCNWYVCNTCHPLEPTLDRAVGRASVATVGVNRNVLRARRDVKAARVCIDDAAASGAAGGEAAAAAEADGATALPGAGAAAAAPRG